MKNFYAKFLAILCTLMMAASSAYAQKAIEFIANSSGSLSHDGVAVTAKYPTENQGFNVFGDMDSEWGWLKVSSMAGNILKIEFEGTADINLLTCSEGSFTSLSTTKSTWEGNSTNITFHSTGDAYVTKLTVYVEEGTIVKDCSVVYDHLGVKPGKVTNIPQYITVYFNEAPAYTLTSGADVPAEARIESEKGNIAVSDFKFWSSKDNDGFYQFSIITDHSVAGTDETEGEYTLVIPEGIIPFESGKWNKEIRINWTLEKPDLRPTKQVVFDFKNGEVYSAGETTSYTEEEVVFDLFGNFYNDKATGFRVKTNEWVKFTAPEHTSLKGIQLLQESSYGVSPDFSASEGEVSASEKILIWSGNNASVTLTDNNGTCYFTKAIVTLAMDEPYVNKETYRDWKNLVTVDMKGVYETYKDANEEELAEPVAAVVKYYKENNELFSVEKGFGDNWQQAADYYASIESSLTAEYNKAFYIWRAYESYVPTVGISNIATTSNDSIYDLSGRRVVKAQNGLYIKNGKKVIF